MIRKLLILLVLPVILSAQSVRIDFKWDKYTPRTDTQEHYKADSSVTHFRIYQIDGTYRILILDDIPKADTTCSIQFTSQDSTVYFAMTAVNPTEESELSNIAKVDLKIKPVVVVFGTPAAPILRSATKAELEQSITICIEVTDIYDSFKCTITNNTANTISDIKLSLNQRVDWIQGAKSNPDVGTNNDGKTATVFTITDVIKAGDNLLFNGDLDGRGEPTGTIEYQLYSATLVKDGKKYTAVIKL